jgi:hypothetical protein
LPQEASWEAYPRVDARVDRKNRMQQPNEPHEPIKDENSAHPVANAWRPTFRDIVKAFTQSDYGLERGIRGVAPVAADVAEQVRDYIGDYGETLVELPDETWETSVSQWMLTHWEVIVDLWTAESGKSDMVLSALVFEVNDGFRIEIDSVHVP